MARKKEHTLFTEKYRTTDIQEYIGNPVLKGAIEKYIRKADVPNMILYGPVGTGKTTLAKLLYTNIVCEYLHIDASDENGIDTIRTKVKNFVSASSFKQLKIVVMDDTHNLTVDAQNAILALIERFAATARFIFTTNHLEKLIPAIQSRLNIHWKIEPPSKKEVAIFLGGILDKEEIEFEVKDIKAIIDKCYPDIRKSVGILQENLTDDNKLVLKLGGVDNTSYLCNILTLLKSPKKDTWREIRQSILDSDVSDFTDIFKYLYDKSEEFAAKKGYEETIFAIAEAQYQHYFVPDKEINLAAMILKIINAIK